VDKDVKTSHHTFKIRELVNLIIILANCYEQTNEGSMVEHYNCSEMNMMSGKLFFKKFTYAQWCNT